VGTLASSSTKTGRHGKAVILLKVALNTNQSKSRSNFGEKIEMCRTTLGDGDGRKVMTLAETKP